MNWRRPELVLIWFLAGGGATPALAIEQADPLARTDRAVTAAGDTTTILFHLEVSSAGGGTTTDNWTSYLGPTSHQWREDWASAWP